MDRWLGLSIALVVFAFCGFWLYARRYGAAKATFEWVRTATVVALMLLAFLFIMTQIPR